MALVALAIVAIIAMAGLSIDVGTLYQASAETQRAADAAALAAARTISMQGLTGDPGNASASWQQICAGASSPASMAAKTVVGQNPISGASTNPTVTVSYSYSTGTPSTDCSSLTGTGFGVNPQVTVLVQQANLPTYFSRIWGRTGNTVGATATAEVFNPSNSATYAGSMVPVQPRCVKPWIVPNLDPLHTAGCTTGCTPFVDLATGSIKTQGVYTSGGVIGERFWLVPDCGTVAPCALLGPPPPQPQANVSQTIDPNAPPPTQANLEYLPGQASFTPIAVPSDVSPACTAVASAANNYAPSIAGCDQSTQYQCGVQGANTVDLSENPGIPGMSDTTNGVQCLIHQTTNSLTFLSGQDALLPTGGNVGSQPPNYPFQIQVGTSNPLINATPNPVPSGGVITSSNNIVSLPIYDSTQTINNNGSTTNVTIVGFLQVFVNVADANGNAYVTVLNVSGCGNAATSGTYVTGTSPVPVRLITPQ